MTSKNGNLCRQHCELSNIPFANSQDILIFFSLRAKFMKPVRIRLIVMFINKDIFLNRLSSKHLGRIVHGSCFSRSVMYRGEYS